MIRATWTACEAEASPRMVAQRRGKKVADILPKRDEAPARGRRRATEEA
jgi:small subunit ribosomal protein S5